MKVTRRDVVSVLSGGLLSHALIPRTEIVGEKTVGVIVVVDPKATEEEMIKTQNDVEAEFSRAKLDRLPLVFVRGVDVRIISD